MKRAVGIALIALLTALTAGTLVGVYDAHRLLSHGQKTLDDYGAAAVAIAETTRQLTGTMAQASKAIDVVNDAALAQKGNWEKTGADVAKTGEDTRRVVAHVDRILTHFSTATLPAIEGQIKSNGDQAQASVAAAGDAAKKMGEAADGLTAVTRTLDAQLADPAIPQMVGRFNTISGNLETISADAVAMSADMKLEVHRLAQPPTKLHTALNVAWTGMKFGSLFIP